MLYVPGQGHYPIIAAAFIQAIEGGMLVPGRGTANIIQRIEGSMNMDTETTTREQDLEYLDRYAEALAFFKEIYRDALRAVKMQQIIQEVALRRMRSGGTC
jgi:hypothetical protein